MISSRARSSGTGARWKPNRPGVLGHHLVGETMFRVGEPPHPAARDADDVGVQEDPARSRKVEVSPWFMQ